MAIYIGGNEITDIKIGSNDINSVWVGGTKVWDRIIDTQTVTVGYYNDGYSQNYGYVGNGASVVKGSVSDGTCNFKSGAAIRRIEYSTFSYVMFELAGSHANSGFTEMNIAGTTYSRSTATYGNDGNNTYWTWNSSTNPFGTTNGATKTVTWR